jgi:hypothetical protein
MGFDLFGLKPQSDRPEPPQPSMKTGKWTDADVKQWEVYEEWRIEAGGYFRNNVWWWHPLWDFACDVCDDILTETDRTEGHGNGGHKISKKKAEAIAGRLYSLLGNGQVEEYEKRYKERLNNLNEKDWNRDYPFHKKNVKAFADFCAKGGGFEIC